jgi:flagellin
MPYSVTLGDLNGDGVLDMVTADQKPSVFLSQTKSGVSPLLPFDLTTMAGARQTLPVFQQKLEQLASQRGEIGAFQSRLSVAVNVLSNTNENYAAASGRIMDADIALESADLVTRQILQQAGSAVLAQANQAPALALMLLSSR